MTEKVDAGDALLRRIRDDPNQFTLEGGRLRVSSAAMSPHPDDHALSVDIRKLIPDPGDPLTAPSVVQGEVEDGVAEFFAREARNLGLSVEHDPLPDNDAHASITGFTNLSLKRAKRVQRELAKSATWVRIPASAT